MNKEMILGLIRHALTIAGGVMASKGIGSADQWEQIGGALSIIVGVAWSMHDKRDGKGGGGTPVAAVLALGLMFATAQGCATAPQSPQRITFNSASSVVTSVDAAMKVWSGYVVGERKAASGDAERLARLEAKEAKVRTAYGQYQAAALSIVTAQESLTNNTTAGAIVQAALVGASGPLLTLVSQLLTK